MIIKNCKNLWILFHRMHEYNQILNLRYVLNFL